MLVLYVVKQRSYLEARGTSATGEMRQSLPELEPTTATATANAYDLLS
jgi:hypothetical protein